MSQATKYALHRPELLAEIESGEQKILRLMCGKTFRFKRGEVLIDADAEHQFIYRLVTGWVCRIRVLDDGRRQCILLFLPGDLFAVKTMLMMRNTDAVIALTDSVVERIHYRDLHAACLANGDVATRCLWQVMEEERRLHNWVVGLGQGDAIERAAMLVLDIRARLMIAGAMALDERSFQWPLTQSQLGDCLGLTAVHVNRVLRVLREEGIVTIRDGVLVIDSFELLVNRARALLDSYERCSGAYVGDTLKQKAIGGSLGNARFDFARPR